MVAPRVGAWIETSERSHPARCWRRSHPVWVRGLKRGSWAQVGNDTSVAPRVGAWIET